jgi:two-component system chemotaxis response regulator CheY
MSAFLLLVGNGDWLQRATRDLLEAYGFRVLIAESGRDALRLLATGFRPRALLLDLDLANFEDAWELRHVQLADPALASIPVLIVSEEISTVAIRGQFRDVALVRKPIRPAVLLAALARCVEPIGGQARAG